jgi:hypothetical protein
MGKQERGKWIDFVRRRAGCVGIAARAAIRGG